MLGPKINATMARFTGSSPGLRWVVWQTIRNGCRECAEGTHPLAMRRTT